MNSRHDCDRLSEAAAKLLLGGAAAGSPIAAGRGGDAAVRSVRPIRSVERDLPQELRVHLERCPHCRKRFADLLRVDRFLRRACGDAGRGVRDPSDETLNGIFLAARQPSDHGGLLRRIRRPVNTVLWLTVLALSAGALAMLAMLLYRVLFLRGA